ncbi:MAG: hypothetical protein AB7O28_10875 [Vicinamibacterales bacterium]
MIRRLFLAGLCLAAVAPSAGAQETATVVKRDGTHVTGRFEAWNRQTNVLYLRLSLADQRRIPLGEAAVIEIGGNARALPASELALAAGDDHVLVPREGDPIVGRLLNIEGGEGSSQDDEPRVVSFRTTGGVEVRRPFGQIQRLYLGHVPSTLTPVANDTPIEEPVLGPGAVRVPATSDWVPTGLVVSRGDFVQFEANGVVQLSADREDRGGPAGAYSARRAPDAPAPTQTAGALIGRVGAGAPFGIGNQTTPLGMPGDGQLFLMVNDDHRSDNAGAFGVSMRVIRRR